MMMDRDLVQIYVYLPDEAVDVWRPVKAEHVGESTYRIASENSDPDIERWEFSTGEIVRCVPRILSDGKHGLVAVERVQPFSS